MNMYNLCTYICMYVFFGICIHIYIYMYVYIYRFCNIYIVIPKVDRIFFLEGAGFMLGIMFGCWPL